MAVSHTPSPTLAHVLLRPMRFLALLSLLALCSPSPASASPSQKLPSKHSLKSLEARLRRQEASWKAKMMSSAQAGKAPKAGTTISLHGNGVLVGGIKVHMIYYGDWAAKSNTLENFVISLGSKSTTPQGNAAADWWSILTKYYNRNSKYVGQVSLGGRTFDKYSQGKDITNKVSSIVAKALKSGSLPTEHNAVYMVVCSADVLESPGNGFCAGTYPFVGTPIGYCGWHTSFTYNRVGVPYAFIGNPNQCVQRCGQLQNHTTTPNGNVGVDAMVNILAHELAEAATNWDTNTGWYTAGGEENGDICNRKFGTMSEATDKSYVYNMVGQGGMRFLVQQMWDRTTSTCKMQL